MAKEIDNRDESPRIDYGIILSVLVLALIGLLAIYVAAYNDSDIGPNGAVKTVLMQGLWYAVGGVAIWVIMQFDSEQLWKIAPLAYGIGIFLLIAVYFLYSRTYFVQTGARSWFALGPFTFQPSEVMKPAFILMLGRVVTQHNTQFQHSMRHDFLLLGKMALWTLPIVILLRMQNDFGTLLVFLAILAGVVLVSGITWRIIIPVIAIATAIGVAAILFVATTPGRNFLMSVGFKQYQFARIDNWLDPSGNTSGTGYQLWNSMQAIGSGQLMGKGFNVVDVHVPVRESDMIFSVIGENFGFIGSCFVIMVFFLLIYQMIHVTFDTKNEFYAYVCTGVIMMILFHVFENIGMSIGLLPLTGIPLPFISQGGSALLGNMIGIGFVMSMRYHYKSYMFSEQDDNF